MNFTTPFGVMSISQPNEKKTPKQFPQHELTIAQVTINTHGERGDGKTARAYSVL